jgi:hypothetical protein
MDKLEGLDGELGGRVAPVARQIFRDLRESDRDINYIRAFIDLASTHCHELVPLDQLGRVAVVAERDQSLGGESSDWGRST